MKLKLSKNKVFVENKGSKNEIHPFWLRERVNGEDFVDFKTQQRLFDPTYLKKEIKINKINLSENFLEIKFSDGVFTKIKVNNILKEFSNINDVECIDKIQWDSSLNNFNSSRMFDLPFLTWFLQIYFFLIFSIILFIKKLFSGR